MKILSWMLFAFLVAWQPLAGTPHEVALTFTSSTVTIKGTNTANGSNDEIEYSLSGTMLAEVELDPDTGRPTAFEFTGGRFEISDFDATGVLLISPVTVEIRGLSSVPGSYQPDLALDPETGALTSGRHFYVQDRGTLVFRNSSGIEFFRRDYSENPLTRNLSDVMTIKAELAAANPLAGRHRITYCQNGDIDDTFELGETIELKLEGRADSTAAGEIVVISAAAREWAHESGGLPFQTLSDRHPKTGESLALLFALGLRADEVPELVISPDQSECSLTLPSTGNRLPVVIEASPDLSSDSWSDLNSDAIIPAGTSGEVTFPLPLGETLFLRLKIEPVPEA